MSRPENQAVLIDHSVGNLRNHCSRSPCWMKEKLGRFHWRRVRLSRAKLLHLVQSAVLPVPIGEHLSAEWHLLKLRLVDAVPRPLESGLDWYHVHSFQAEAVSARARFPVRKVVASVANAPGPLGNCFRGAWRHFTPLGAAVPRDGPGAVCARRRLCPRHLLAHLRVIPDCHGRLIPELRASSKPSERRESGQQPDRDELRGWPRGGAVSMGRVARHAGPASRPG
mmetsp:Transcript_18659/g.47236  ORF Transcript_18659/g.47236 Transcript_18659/m.47236 type:complete len:225 (-) Transcript_18659:7-681(-)